MSKPMYGDLLFKKSQTAQFEDADGSAYVSIGSPAVVASNLDFKLPAADLSNGVISSNGSGILSIALLVNANVASGAAIDAAKIADGSVSNAEFQFINSLTSNAQTQLDGKASTALSNLASVAINTSLISDTNNTDDLGSAAIGWANGYINALRMDSNGQTTGLQGSASASASVNYSLPPADGSSGFVLSTNGSGVLSWISNASLSSFKTDWETADTDTFQITHNLNSVDLMVSVYDIATGEDIEIDSIVRDDSNNITVTASEAPPAGSWRVLIVAV